MKMRVKDERKKKREAEIEGGSKRGSEQGEKEMMKVLEEGRRKEDVRKGCVAGVKDGLGMDGRRKTAQKTGGREDDGWKGGRKD